MDYIETERMVEDIVRNTFLNSMNKTLPYHNLEHTRRVVVHAGEIAKYYRLNIELHFIVLMAAWFHDIGYIYGGEDGHEQTGVFVMELNLQRLSVDAKIIASIAGCIKATRHPSNPKNAHEGMVCDADTYDFGTLNFRETYEPMKRERELRIGTAFADWPARSIRMLEEHRYHSEYCRQLLDAGKRENIEWLRSQT